MVKDNDDPPRPYSHTFVHGSLWCVDRAHREFAVSIFRRPDFNERRAMHMAAHIYTRVSALYIYVSPVLCTNFGPKGSGARAKKGLVEAGDLPSGRGQVRRISSIIGLGDNITGIIGRECTLPVRPTSLTCYRLPTFGVSKTKSFINVYTTCRHR